MKKLLQTLTLTTSLIVLSGCALFTETVYVDRVKYVPQSIQHPVQPNEMSLLEVDFKVISKADFLVLIDTLLLDTELNLSVQQQQIIADKLAKFVFKEDEALWTLNSQSYSNLGINMQEIKRYISQQKNLVIYYRDTVLGPEDVQNLQETSID